MPAKLIEVHSDDFIYKDRILYDRCWIVRNDSSFMGRTYATYIYQATPKWFKRNLQNGNIIRELDYSHEILCDQYDKRLDRVIEKWKMFDTGYVRNQSAVLFAKFKTDTDLFLFQCEYPEYTITKLGSHAFT